MDRGNVVLIIVIHWLIDFFKAPAIKHPYRSCTVIFIKDSFREIQSMLLYHAVPIYLDHHASRPHGQFFVLFQSAWSRLLIRIIPDNSSHFHGVFRNQIVIAANHIRTGFFCFSYQLLIKIRCDPVVTVDKTDPFS